MIQHRTPKRSLFTHLFLPLIGTTMLFLPGCMGSRDGSLNEETEGASSDGENEDQTETPETPEDLSAAGPFTFSTASSDESGLETEIYLPSGPGPFPIVVLTHGFQLSPDDYISYGEHLASWGYLALLPKFSGNLFSSPTHSELKDSLSGLLDWIESDPSALSGLADDTNLGLAGHSMGGKVALLLASEDERPKAVFAIDPVDAGPPNGGSPSDYPSVAPELMGNIEIPLVLLGEIQNAAAGGFGPACAPEGENFQAYYSAATSPALEVEVVGASHMSFLDDPSCLVCLACPAGSDDPVQTKAITRELMTAFFAAELQEEEWASLWLEGEGLQELSDSDLILTQSKNGF